MFASIFALALYSIVLVWIGSIYRDKTSPDDFHIAGRKVGVVRLAASTFTLIGGGEFVTLTALSYVYGAWSILFFAGVAVGFIVLSLLAKRARVDSVSGDMYSLPDFFALHFGIPVSLATTVLTTIALGALLLIQLVVGGMMLNITIGIPIWACIVGMSLVVCIYVYLGGFNGVLTTDLVQAIAMFGIILIALLAYSGSDVGSAEDIIKHTSLPPSEAIVLLIAGFCAVIGGADVWQRVLAGKDDKSTRHGLLLNAGGWLIFGGLVVALALKVQSNQPEADPNTAFFLLLETGLPKWLSAMFALLLFSALISTADTELFLISVMANKEIGRIRKSKEVSTKTTKLYVIVVTIIACVLGIFLQTLVDVYFILLYIMMILGPVSLAKLLGRGSKTLAMSSIAGGTIVLLLLTITDNLSGVYPVLICCPGLIMLLKQERLKEARNEGKEMNNESNGSNNNT